MRSISRAQVGTPCTTTNTCMSQHRRPRVRALRHKCVAVSARPTTGVRRKQAHHVATFRGGGCGMGGAGCCGLTSQDVRARRRGVPHTSYCALRNTDDRCARSHPDTPGVLGGIAAAYVETRRGSRDINEVLRRDLATTARASDSPAASAASNATLVKESAKTWNLSN